MILRVLIRTIAVSGLSALLLISVYMAARGA